MDTRGARDPSVDAPLRVLGSLALWRADAEVALPRSKKTRALLAYLAISGRSHRRARLCELLWDVTDDPRGALRWSLSKLRGLLPEGAVVADRESIAITLAHDLSALRAAAEHAEDLDEGALAAAASLVRGELLEGLELPDFDELTAWLVAQREEARRHHRRVLEAWLSRLSPRDDRALEPARALVRLDPYDEAARLALVTRLHELGRVDEALAHLESASRLAAELGRPPSPSVRELRRTLTAPTSRPPPPEAAREAPPPSAARPALTLRRTTLHEAPLRGREAERDLLFAALSDVTNEPRLRASLVIGEPGIGKSRLLHELHVEARRRGATVLDARAFEAERRRAFGPWLDALGRARWPEAAGARDLLLGAPESEARLHEGIADALAARASDAPLVLTFDDAQWLDDASVTLLHAVVRRLRRRPTLLVLAARRGELPDAAASRELLRALRRDRALDTVALGPLGVEALAQIVQTVGATTPDQPADLSRLVAEASGGNPLYALELARAGGEIGPSLRELVSDRLAPLREPALEVLRWGAIFGPTFDASWIEATVDLEADALLRALEELEAAGLVATSDPGGAELQLAHQLVHEVVYGGISAPRRRLMHARAAALLERLAARDVALVTEVARHALAAGDPSRAVRAHLDASAHLRRVFASHEAWRAAQRGLRAAEALPDPERTQATVELWRASLLARPAERGESARLVETIEALAERALDLGLDASARLAFRLASWLRWELDRPSEARLTMLRAEEISRDVSGGERVLALAEAARCLVLLERDLPQAEAWVREASALVRRGDPEPAALADASGRLAMHRGALDDAEPLLRRARDLARREHDASNEARAIEQLAHLACLRGLVIDALTHAEELVRRLERDPPPGGALPHARGLRALCQLRLGRPGAQEAVDAALDELEAVDAKRSLGLLSRATGEALSLRGDAERALPYAERATRCASALSSPSERALCHALAASVARALGDEDAARREAEAARAHAAAPLSAEARAALDALSTKAVG